MLLTLISRMRLDNTFVMNNVPFSRNKMKLEKEQNQEYDAKKQLGTCVNQ